MSRTIGFFRVLRVRRAILCPLSSPGLPGWIVSAVFPFSLGEAHSNHAGDPRDQLKGVVYGVLVLANVADRPVGR